MENNETLALTDETAYPDDEVLREALGESFPAYGALLDIFKANGLDWEWRYYKDGKAWLCKAQHKKKTIVWMSVWRGFLRATVYVSEKYIDSLNAIPISEAAKSRFLGQANVGKLRPCTFEIRKPDDLPEFTVLMKHKMTLK